MRSCISGSHLLRGLLGVNNQLLSLKNSLLRSFQKNPTLKLSDRVFVCTNPECRHTEDRDLHASLNLAQVPFEHISSRVGTIRN